MKKTILFLLLFVSNCFAQYNPQFLTQPPVGYQINLAHPDAQGLVGRWLFNEGGGQTVYDLSPYSHHGILINWIIGTGWVTGRDGHALTFDASTNHIELTSSPISPATNLTIGSVFAWVKSSAFGSGFRGLVVKKDSYSMFAVDEDFSIFDWGSASTRSSGVLINDDEWRYVGVTFDSGVTNGTVLYVDGLPVLTTTMTVSNQNTELSFGSGGSSAQPMSGEMSSVTLHNRILTAQEVLSNFIYSYAMFEQPPGRILAAAAAAAPTTGTRKGVRRRWWN